MRLELSPFVLSLCRPLLTARGAITDRRGWVVTFRAADGIGRGEAAPLAAFGTETPAAALEALQGFELARPPASLADVAAATRGLAATPAARFAVEGALLDYLGRRQGIPVAALLVGTNYRARLPVSALLEADDERSLVRAGAAAVTAGFGTVKVKVAARPLAIETGRLAALRQAIGRDARLRVDANGGWTEATAGEALATLAAHGIELCEQPVPAAEVEALRRLARRAPCPIAADEAVLDPARWPRLLEPAPEPAARVLVLKPMALGGLLPSLALARRAHAAGVAAFVTTLLDGPTARAGAAHLAAALPGDGDLAHGLATVELFADTAADPYTPRGGVVTIPDAPGWGLP